MKLYPSIPRMKRDCIPNTYLYLFSKIDGSNIRAEWNDKRGFYKFGTRTQLMDEKSMPFGRAIPLLREKYESSLTSIFNNLHWKDAICFFEYHGPDSFAGNHNFEERMDITLLDVNPYKQGILEPAKFIQTFGHLDIPRVCYQGHVSVELFDQVKQSTLPGMSHEGVVCKGATDKKIKMPIMFKIKSQAWLDKLSEYCQGDIGLFEKLA